MRKPSRRTFLGFMGAIAAAAVHGRIATGAGAPATWSPFPFYVMDTGLVGPDVNTLEKKVALASELGFTGVDFQFDPGALPRQLELLDRYRLELTAVYATPTIEGQLDGRMGEAIKLMKGRPTRIELALSSRKFKPSDPAGDEVGLEMVRRVSDMAGDTGPVVSIYPHRSSWTERTEDGIRIARAIERDNVGTNFNLVHWKWLKPNAPLEALLKEALPFLKTVTINGLKGDQIVSLDQGDYDLEAFLSLLKQVGYRGRVGLQGYSVPGPSRDHLSRSMKRWKEMMARIA